MVVPLVLSLGSLSWYPAARFHHRGRDPILRALWFREIVARQLYDENRILAVAVLVLQSRVGGGVGLRLSGCLVPVAQIGP